MYSQNEVVMDITSEFNEKFYVTIKDVLSPYKCEQAVQRLFSLSKDNKTVNDDQCPLSEAVYGDPYFDEILEKLTAAFSDATGKNLIPTYSYARIYRSGEILKIHKDRPACEISATITLGYCNSLWPIYFSLDNNADLNTDNKPVIAEVGDVVLYKGTEIYHWRDKFEGDWQCQVFLHYVDADGPFKNERFDRREKLGTSADSKIKHRARKTEESFHYWQYDTVLSHDFCNSVIGAYGHKNLHDGSIGSQVAANGSINKDIRNVKNTLIPLHEGIGAHMVGSAFIANQQAWRFKITSCEQIEYLKYDKEGRYLPHIDTFLSKPNKITRKLTALAFLNDDFEGGKFFLQISNERIYPFQKKGTIIVFPSFLLHGVEDVISGVRHAVVCWMSGPSFR